MKKFTKEQKYEALELVEEIAHSFLNEEGLVDIKFETALLNYRQDSSRGNYIRVLVSLCLSDIFMPYKPLIVDGKVLWSVEVDEYKGKKGQYIATGLDKISKNEAIKYSWYVESGYNFFGENSHWRNKDFLIVNHEKDYFAFLANDIVKVCEYVKRCDKDTCDYTDDDVITFAEIIANRKTWKESKTYCNKATSEKYNGFIHILYDDFNFGAKTFYIVDKTKGMIELSEEEYKSLEEIA